MWLDNNKFRQFTAVGKNGLYVRATDKTYKQWSELMMFWIKSAETKTITNTICLDVSVQGRDNSSNAVQIRILMNLSVSNLRAFTDSKHNNIELSIMVNRGGTFLLTLGGCMGREGLYS